MKVLNNYNVSVPELGDLPNITQVSDALEAIEESIAGNVEFMYATVSGNQIVLTSDSRNTERLRYYEGMSLQFTAKVAISANTIQTIKVDSLTAQPASIPFNVGINETLMVTYTNGSFVAKYFSIAKSDSVTSNDQVVVASSKAVKTACDKGVSAYSLAETKEDTFVKKSGFNKDKSDAINSTSTETLATSKAVKTAYDIGSSGVSKADDAQSTANEAQTKANEAQTKANEAYVLADGKEPRFNKKTGFNLDITDLVSSTSKILLASAYAVKLAYDKGVEALGLANTNKIAIQDSTEQIYNLSTENFDETVLFDGSSTSKGIIELIDDWDNYKEILFVGSKNDLTNVKHSKVFVKYITPSDATETNSPHEYTVYSIDSIFKSVCFRDTNRSELYVTESASCIITKIIGIGKNGLE